MLYLLVTAADWRGRPVRVTSLPSWSCGFDSRRPLHRLSLHRDVPRHWNGHDPHWLQGFPGRRDGIHGNLLVIVARGPASAGGCSMVEAGPDSPRSLTNRAGRRGRLGRPASARRGGPRVLGIDSQRLPQAVPGFPVAEQSIQRTARGPAAKARAKRPEQPTISKRHVPHSSRPRVGLSDPRLRKAVSSARDYQDPFGPLAIPATAGQTGDQSACSCTARAWPERPQASALSGGHVPPGPPRLWPHQEEMPGVTTRASWAPTFSGKPG